MNISEVRVTFDEAIYRYRSSLEFENTLLVQNFEIRYAYHTEDLAKLYRLKGISDERIAKWIKRRNASFPKRFELYKGVLSRSVAINTARYAMKLRMAYGFAEQHNNG